MFQNKKLLLLYGSTEIGAQAEFGMLCYYAHTNRFCVAQENSKPEVLKVSTKIASSAH